MEESWLKSSILTSSSGFRGKQKRMDGVRWQRHPKHTHTQAHTQSIQYERTDLSTGQMMMTFHFSIAILEKRTELPRSSPELTGVFFTFRCFDLCYNSYGSKPEVRMTPLRAGMRSVLISFTGLWMSRCAQSLLSAPFFLSEVSKLRWRQHEGCSFVSISCSIHHRLQQLLGPTAHGDD